MNDLVFDRNPEKQEETLRSGFASSAFTREWENDEMLPVRVGLAPEQIFAALRGASMVGRSQTSDMSA